MGVRSIIVVGVTIAAVSRAAAGPREDALALAQQATERAAAGDLAGAVTLFKRAYGTDARAEYQCNIGAAYFKLHDLPRAHAFLTVCLARAGALKPEAAASFREVLTFVDGELRGGGYAAVDVTVDPPAALVRPALFADDETFAAPHTFWLPLGKHDIVATATGFQRGSRQVDLTRNERVPLRLQLEPTPPPPPPERIPGSRRPAAIALISAVGFLAIGVTFHVLAASTRDDLSRLPAGPDYDDTHDRFALQRGVAIGGYALAAVGTGVGIYLWRRAARGTLVPAAAVGADGAAITLSGRF